MKVTAENFRVAWDLAKTFLENRNETLLMLEVETEPTKMNYAIVKIPYGKDTSLLFSPEESQECMYPGRNLKYAGFYNYTEANAYAVSSPIDRFLGFDKELLTEHRLKDIVIEAIQQAVSEHIVSNVKEFSGLSVDTGDSSLTDDAEKAFSKQETKVNFGNKIVINDWSISHRDLVDFIDDKENFLKRKVEIRVKGNEQELARLWVAHQASQRILDQLYAVNQ